MNRWKLPFLVFCITVFSSAVVSRQALASLTLEERLADFNQLVTLIEQNYAPLRWKQRSIGLDWDAHKEEFREKVLRAYSDQNFYQILSRFLTGLNDSHVTISVPSSYQARLGFLCDYVEGKVLIEKINRKQLPKILFPFDKGDELVSIDGRPVAEILSEIKETINTGFSLSTDRIAAASLTLRRESKGFSVPSGFVSVTVLKQGAETPQTVMVTWENKGRSVLDINRFAATPSLTESVFSSESDFARKIQSLSLYDMSLSQSRIEELQQVGLSDIGSNTSMFALPEGAVSNPLSPVTMATFKRAGKTIGILRVPNYGDPSLIDLIIRNLQMLQSQVDVLVLDQTNNPGGAVNLVSLLASVFMENSTKDVQFAVRPSRKWLEAFEEVNKEINSTLNSSPNDQWANALKPRFQYLESLIWDSLQAGRYLTVPFSLDLSGSAGIIQPHSRFQFTKPVLLLINEFDFSGGDVFPAIMQDAGRATLFGERTSGAGGNVAQYGPLTNSYFRFSLTESLIIRANGEYIENQGVTPDIEYAFNRDDFMNNYKSYVEAFTCAALALIDTDCSVAPEEPADGSATPDATPVGTGTE